MKDEGTFVWQDGTALSQSYVKWKTNYPKDGTDEHCVIRRGNQEWQNTECYRTRRFFCSMPAADLCDASVISVVKDIMNKQECIQPILPDENDTQSVSDTLLPNVDVFLNPAKKEYMGKIVREKQHIAKNYFNNVDMKSLFPELFSILWESTLPCYVSPENNEYMLLSCQLAGAEVNCSDLFTKVPTDTGMCCALNNLDSLRNSKYKEMVKELQGNTPLKKQADARVGQRNGLRLTLDLHSNTVSFGTLDQEYEGFSVFIGHPAEFPMMKEKSIKLEPGREHFIDLSATVVSASDIKAIAPEDRHCFFQDESDLDFYKRYTFSNCRLECAIETLEKIFDCVPWHLPRVNNSLHFSKLIIFHSGRKLNYLRPLDFQGLHCTHGGSNKKLYRL